MKFLSRQKIFNKVFKHLHAQGKSFSDDSATCAYRGTFGRTCAIGCLLTEYSTAIEGCTIASMLGPDGYDLLGDKEPGLLTALLFESGIDATDVDFLQALQDLHDQWDCTPSGLYRNAKFIATAYALKMPGGFDATE